MLQFILFLNAGNSIFIADRHILPLHSKAKFKYTDYRLMYDTLIQYSQTYQYSDDWNGFLMSLRNRIKHHSDNLQSKPSAEIIKIWFIEHISVILGLEKFEGDMCKFGSSFDSELYHYCSVLFEFDMEKIIASAKKDFIHYHPVDYTINKSLSFVVITFVSILFEIIIYEIENGRWTPTISACFGNVIAKYMPKCHQMSTLTFDHRHANYKNKHFRLKSIFRRKIKYLDSLVRLKMNRKESDKSNIIYSLPEILEVYEHCNKTYKHSLKGFRTNVKNKKKNVYVLPQKTSERMECLLQRNKRIEKIQNVIKTLKTWNMLKDYTLIVRDAAKYEYFFRPRKEVSKKYTFDKWKEDTLAYEQKLLAAKEIYKKWMLMKLETEV